MKKADLILHPIRMRILVSVAGRQMTVQALAKAMPDVAQATLYRHVNALASGGLLDVVEEQPVRGTVERTYAVPDGAALLGEGDLSGATKEDHMRFFSIFVAMLAGQFAHYLESRESRAQLDLAADGVGYHSMSVYLSDDELAAFSQALAEALGPFLEHGPAPGRKRRLFSTVLIPAGDDEE